MKTKYSEDEIKELRDNASKIGCWSFTNAIGENLKEKYESLNNYLNEVGPNMSCITSPEICSIFECDIKFEPITSSLYEEIWQSEDSHGNAKLIGSINNRHLYKGCLLPLNEIILTNYHSSVKINIEGLW